MLGHRGPYTGEPARGDRSCGNRGPGWPRRRGVFRDEQYWWARHGFGRINAYDAVRIVGTYVAGGNRGVDLFMRDNVLDWGNEEQWSNRRYPSSDGELPYWESMDIKVDAPPFEVDPPTLPT